MKKLNTAQLLIIRSHQQEVANAQVALTLANQRLRGAMVLLGLDPDAVYDLEEWGTISTKENQTDGHLPTSDRLG